MSSEDWYDVDDYHEKRVRQCSPSCAHFDAVNLCCWQATEKGLCFDVEESDYCHLGYKEGEG